MSFLIAIDPGRIKCGLLLADVKSGIVIEAGIAKLNALSDLILFWENNYLIDKIIIGNGTNSKFIENELKKENFNNLTFVNEGGSTLRARFRYWEIWPPNYFFRCLPKEMLFPPKNLDAVVALILLEDFLNCRFIWPEKVNIKIWP